MPIRREDIDIDCKIKAMLIADLRPNASPRAGRTYMPRRAPKANMAWILVRSFFLVQYNLL